MTLTFKILKRRAEASKNRNGMPTEKTVLQRRIYENMRVLREMDDDINRIVAMEMDKPTYSDPVYISLNREANSSTCGDQSLAERCGRYSGLLDRLLHRKMTDKEYNSFLSAAKKRLKITKRFFSMKELTSGSLLLHNFYNLREIGYFRKDGKFYREEN